jgi:phosphate transport system protein
MSSREHTCKHYEERLRLLKEKLLLMGHKAKAMVADSIRAYDERCSSLAKEIIQRDCELDLLEREIDESCLELLALDHPLAIDLRLVTSSIKIVRDLERIGDLGVNIAERVTELVHQPEQKSCSGITMMAIETQRMLKDSLDSLALADVALAQKVILNDRIIDAMYEEVFHKYLEQMSNEPAAICGEVGRVFVAKSLERIGDHSVNIAEMVIFLVRGRDIRHGSCRLYQETPGR